METNHNNICECDDCFMAELLQDPVYLDWLAEREQDYYDYMEAMTDDQIMATL